MKTKLLLASLLIALTLALLTRRYYLLADRLENDRRGLLVRIETLTTQHDSLTNRCEVLRLDCSEFERLYRTEAERLKQLKIKLRRTEAIGIHITESRLHFSAPQLPPTPRPATSDTLRHFRWSDPWNSVEGTLSADSVQCRIRSIDTLHQVVHRVPRRFLFFRWGTKALRQEIHTSNPSTRIVYSDYVIIAR